jgi:hypothetical protein
MNINQMANKLHLPYIKNNYEEIIYLRSIDNISNSFAYNLKV